MSEEKVTAPPDFSSFDDLFGLDIHEGSRCWETHALEFFAIGTAVLPLDQEIAPEKIADPNMVLSVNDRSHNLTSVSQ